MKYILLYLLVINIYGLALMFSDKSKSRKGKWRIPEKKIFLTAALLGSPGILLGMQLFRHKTKHLSFTIGIPLILVIQLYIACRLWFRFA